MKSRYFSLKGKSIAQFLKNEMYDQVFHVTPLSNLEPILESGYITWNPGRTNFLQSYSNYCFHNQSVSLFDFRDIMNCKSCYISDALNVIERLFNKEKRVAVFVLNRFFYNEIIIIPKESTEDRIWHLESAFPEKLSVEKIYEIIIVTL